MELQRTSPALRLGERPSVQLEIKDLQRAEQLGKEALSSQ